MPTAYVFADFDFEVDLSDDELNDQFETWTDKALAETRTQYKKSNLGFWLQAPNDNDPISPFAIPAHKDNLIDGDYIASNNKKLFRFLCRGKFKVNITKETKSAIDAGLEFRLIEVSINGSSHNVEDKHANKIIVSLNK